MENPKIPQGVIDLSNKIQIKGSNLLLWAPHINNFDEAGIEVPRENYAHELARIQNVGLVMQKGSFAFDNPKRFGTNGEWSCEVGDWISIANYNKHTRMLYPDVDSDEFYLNNGYIFWEIIDECFISICNPIWNHLPPIYRKRGVFGGFE